MSKPKVMAAQRDASWHSRPSRNGGKFHIIVDGGVAACSKNPYLRGGTLVLQSDTEAMPARQVHPVLRCKRNGCRQVWPTVP